MVIIGAYKNGVLKLPVQLNIDTSADFVTKEVLQERQKNATTVVNYTIVDANGKNLSGEGTTFSYNFDKLYRFKIKAGIAYSTFKGRNYTVNTANNTANYTNAWTGLAPSLGVQVFPVPLEVESKKFLPHGLAPFGYVGYLFNGAPGNNLLLGGGWELYSGIAFTVGAHIGRSQRLELTEGVIQEQDYYKPAFFFSLNIGLEAFNIIFGTGKPSVNPFKAP